MADQQQTPYMNSAASLKAKYMEALRIHVMEPMRRDLLEMQAQLRAEVSSLDLDGGDLAAAKLGLENEHSRIERVLHALDAELERARNLRLSDYDVAAPVVGQAAELAAR